MLLGNAGAITRVDEKQAVAKAERRAPEQRDKRVANPRAKAAIDDRARDQEREHDQEDRPVRKPGVRLLGLDDATEDRGGNRQHRSRKNRQRVDDDGDDGGGEDREEPPRVDGQSVRRRSDPDTGGNEDDRNRRCHSTHEQPMSAWRLPEPGQSPRRNVSARQRWNSGIP